MSPTNIKLWRFGVLLSLSVLALSIGIRNVPGMVIGIVGLLFLFRNHEKDKKESTGEEPLGVLYD